MITASSHRQRNKCTLQVVWLWHTRPHSPPPPSPSLHFRSRYPCGAEILALLPTTAKRRRVIQCVCGPESAAKNQYNLITEQMDNISASDFFFFFLSTEGAEQAFGKTNKAEWHWVCQLSPSMSELPRWPLSKQVGINTICPKRIFKMRPLFFRTDRGVGQMPLFSIAAVALFWNR